MEHSHRGNIRLLIILLALAMLMTTHELSVFAEKATERTRAAEETVAASAGIAAASDAPVAPLTQA